MSHFYITAFIAVTGYAALGVLAKKVQADIPAFYFIAITMTLLAIFSLCTALLFEKNFTVSSLPPRTWLWMAAFSLINLLAFGFLLYTYRGMPVVEYQIIAVITPIIGGLMAYFLLSEALTARYFLGLLLIGAGLYISLKK